MGNVIKKTEKGAYILDRHMYMLLMVKTVCRINVQKFAIRLIKKQILIHIFIRGARLYLKYLSMSTLL